MQSLSRSFRWATACLLASIALPGVAASPGREAPAFGLIVGLRPDAQAVAGGAAQQGPWASSREARQALAARQFRHGRERVTQVVREAGLSVRGLGAVGDAQVLRFERPLSGAPLQDAMRRARLHPEVAWVEPDVLLRRQQTVTPTDPQWPVQWALGLPSPPNLTAINLPPAWRLTTGSSLVHIAVLDSGILPHPDLAGRVLPGYDFVSEDPFDADGHPGRDEDPTDPGDWVTRTEANDKRSPFFKCTWDGISLPPYPKQESSWHGTFIAGQVGAATNNGVGIAGVTWAGKVLPVRVSGKCGAKLSDLLDGMRWAAGLPVDNLPLNPNPARVINLSFGGSEPCSRSAAYQTTIDAVTAEGSLVVVAGGNAATQLTRPADCQRVLTVGAVRRDGLKTDYSSYGPRVGLMAAGGSMEGGIDSLLYSTSNSGTTSAFMVTAGEAENSYGYQQGTSFSAPWAAGVAALMLSVNPQLSPAQLIDRLRLGVRRWGELSLAGPVCDNRLASQGVCACSTDTCGSGLLDAERALQLALGPAVVIAPVDTAAPGAMVALDGSGSVAVPGAQIVAYRWAQLEGPGVSIRNDSTAVVGVTLASAGTYVFQLTVTDHADRVGRDSVRIVVAAPTSDGGGGGATGLWWGGLLWLWVAALGHTRLRCRRSR